MLVLQLPGWESGIWEGEKLKIEVAEITQGSFSHSGNKNICPSIDLWEWPIRKARWGFGKSGLASLSISWSITREKQQLKPGIVVHVSTGVAEAGGFQVQG